MDDFPVLSHKPGLQITRHGPPSPVHGDMLLTIPGLLTVEEAQQCIEYATALGFTHQSSRGPAYGEAFRDNDRVSVQDQGIADAIWHSTGLSKALKGKTVDGMRPVGCNPNIRFYRYSKGHRFGKHYDESIILDDGKCTWYTVLIYLSGQSDSNIAGEQGQEQQAKNGQGQGQPAARTKRAKKSAGTAAEEPPAQQQQPPCTAAVQDLQGGETVFYDDRSRVVTKVQPKPGLCLLHMHGEDRCLEHEALLVKQGTKYVLRTDVVFQ